MGAASTSSGTDVYIAESKVHLAALFGALLSQHWAVGAECRQKPNNLGIREDDWRDVFVAYLPNKSLSVTAALSTCVTRFIN